MDDETEWIVSPAFTFFDCTCEHEPEQHGWGSCNVDDCECDGGWEE